MRKTSHIGMNELTNDVAPAGGVERTDNQVHDTCYHYTLGSVAQTVLYVGVWVKTREESDPTLDSRNGDATLRRRLFASVSGGDAGVYSTFELRSR